MPFVDAIEQGPVSSCAHRIVVGLVNGSWSGSCLCVLAMVLTMTATRDERPNDTTNTNNQPRTHDEVSAHNVNAKALQCTETDEPVSFVSQSVDEQNSTN